MWDVLNQGLTPLVNPLSRFLKALNLDWLNPKPIQCLLLCAVMYYLLYLVIHSLAAIIPLVVVLVLMDTSMCRKFIRGLEHISLVLNPPWPGWASLMVPLLATGLCLALYKVPFLLCLVPLCLMDRTIMTSAYSVVDQASTQLSPPHE